MILMCINANGQNSAFVKMNAERYQNTHVLIYYMITLKTFMWRI